MNVLNSVDRKVFQKLYQPFISHRKRHLIKSASNLPFKHLCFGWTNTAIACGRDGKSKSIA
ncbi:hypothetical protein H6G81_02845 [Scytonema hofmannii FACHB-248]|uniref:Transposase n=1 Tax=Scytonema hofmannii FACHB-248 TaxID=1842502 RepID=A0ABR8GL75_9CYAN|nr:MULTISPECIES: hypothetical protein [Nostocales]MBD2603493.1 hypothetical protein [Scytonema hofmannii FACHB-248]